MENWQLNQDAGYYQAGAMDHEEAKNKYGGGSIRPEDVKPITSNQDPASNGGSVDGGGNNNGVNSAADFTNNFFQGFKPFTILFRSAQLKPGIQIPFVLLGYVANDANALNDNRFPFSVR